MPAKPKPLIRPATPLAPTPPVELPSVIERLRRLEELLVELVDLAPRIAYSARQAGLQLGDVSESTVRRAVAAGDLTRVPHLGTRVVISDAELRRFAAERPGALRAAS